MTDVDNLFVLNELLDQLDSKDPRERRSAARELGNLRDVAAIEHLARVYRRDADETVKKAAGDALKIYRQMEVEQFGRKAEATGDNPLVKRLRGILTISLVVGIVFNLGLIGFKFLRNSGGTGGGTINLDPQPREKLVELFGNSIKEMDTLMTQMRPSFQDISGRIQLNLLPTCTAWPPTNVSLINIAQVDMETYPDMGPLNRVYNEAAGQYLSIRDSYTKVCAIKDINSLKTNLDSLGGKDYLIRLMDTEFKPAWDRANTALRVAIESPAATITPTPLPTGIPTLPPQPTPLPGTTSAVVAPTTPPVVNAATPVPGATTVAVQPTGFSFGNFSLLSFKRYSYTLTVKYIGFADDGRAVNGTFGVSALRQIDPPIGQYGISFNENVPFLKSKLYPDFPQVFEVKGDSRYFVVNNQQYHVRNICETFPNDAVRKIWFDSLGPDQIFTRGTSIARAPFQETGPNQYTGEVTRTEGNATITEKANVTVLPGTSIMQKIDYSLVRTNGESKPGLDSLTITYVLNGTDDAVNVAGVAKPAGCS